MDRAPDETRHSVCTPDGRYRYQLAEHEGEEVTNLFTVWRLDADGSWLTESMIHVDETGHGPEMVGHPVSGRTGEIVDAYMRAAGHIWAANQAGLWDKPLS